MTLRKPKCPQGWDKRIRFLAGSLGARVGRRRTISKRFEDVVAKR